MKTFKVDELEVRILESRAVLGKAAAEVRLHWASEIAFICSKTRFTA